MNRPLLLTETRLAGIRAAIRYLGIARAQNALENPLPVIGRHIPARFTPKPVDPRHKPIHD